MDQRPGSKDKYSSFFKLSLHEQQGIHFEISYRTSISDTIVIAPHGGGIEPGTAELAEAIAGEEYCFYCFKGIKKFHNWDLHITSTNFDEPCGVDLVARSARTIALHGCVKRTDVIYLGGLDTGLKMALMEKMLSAGLTAEESVDFPGLQPENICNRNTRGMGVQMELGGRLRESFFADLTTPAGRRIRTERFDLFVEAVRRGLAELKVF